jgi:transposase
VRASVPDRSSESWQKGSRRTAYAQAGDVEHARTASVGHVARNMADVRAAGRIYVSRPTARKWVRRYETEAGLAERPATAGRGPHRLSGESKAAIR